MAKKKNVEAKETKTKKGFKETFKEKTAKVKAIWDDYKVAIVAGAIGVASSAALVYLVTEGDGNVTEVPVPTLPEPKEEPKALPEPKSCRSDFDDDMKLEQLICEEIDLASTEAKIMEHFEAVNDLCNEKDIVYNLCGSFGGKLEDNYMGTMIFKDGTCIKDTM